uniref:Lipocalin/cytosolic fatty-acid binding domain-containing protein n=1 Tax=Lepisosteus oculatus TaxID=7918 RepID=W5M0M9_LEPOC
MVLLYFAAVFSIAALSSAAPLQCEGTVKPLIIEDPTEIFGKWFLLAAATDYKVYQDMLKDLQSSWIEFSPLTANTTVLNQGYKMNTCIWTSTVMNMINNSGVLTFEFLGNTTGTVMETCPECLLLDLTSREGEHLAHSFYIFARSRELRLEYREEYLKQLYCLGLPPPTYVDLDKELCPYNEKNASSTDVSKTGQRLT